MENPDISNNIDIEEVYKNNKFKLEEYLFEFKDRLFNILKRDYKNLNTESLYQETIITIINILFLCIKNQRKLRTNKVEFLFEKERIIDIKEVLNEYSSKNDNNKEYKELIYKYYSLLKNWCEEFSKLQLNVPVDILDILVEDSWEKNINTKNATKNSASKKRREYGSYYTGSDLVNIVVNPTIDTVCNNRSIEEILKLKIIDPSVGSGKFLRGVLKRLLHNITAQNSQLTDKEYNDLKKNIILNCLYGVDINVIAIYVNTYIFWIEANDKNLDIKKVAKNFIEGDSLLSNFITIDRNDLHNSRKLDLLEKSNYYVVGALISGEKNLEFDKVFNNIIEISSTEEGHKYIEIGKKTKSFIWSEKFAHVFIDNGGFDVIVGNPPWNKIKAHIKEFFEHYDDCVKNLQGESLKKYIQEKYLTDSYYNELWKSHVLYQKQYSQAISNSGYYKYQSYIVDGKSVSGDRDLYKYFIELSYNLVNNNGYVGFIVPASIVQAEGATGLRNLIFDNTNIKFIMTIENRDKVFPIDGRFKYSIIIFKKSKVIQNSIQCAFMIKNLDGAIKKVKENDFINITKKLIDKVSPNNRSIPEVKTEFEVKLLNKIYTKHPLINSLNGWKMKFNRELDMTNDSKLFVHKNDINIDEECLPLYEGRMIQQFDYSAKRYKKGEGRKAEWENNQWENKEICPHFYVRKSDASMKGIVFDTVRPCYCDIAGQTNERAVQSAIIPANTVAGNKVPTVNIYPNNIANNLLWVALTNSFVFDWIMRQRISTTINFFHWNQTPLPIVDLNSNDARTIVINSARLCLTGEAMRQSKNELIEFFKDDISKFNINECTNPVERQILRAEIDVIVAKLYELTINELCYVIDQFKLLDRSQPIISNNKESKSTITRDLILLRFLEKYGHDMEWSTLLLEGIEFKNIDICMSFIRERVNRAFEKGAIAYIYG